MAAGPSGEINSDRAEELTEETISRVHSGTRLPVAEDSLKWTRLPQGPTLASFPTATPPSSDPRKTRKSKTSHRRRSRPRRKCRPPPGRLPLVQRPRIQRHRSSVSRLRHPRNILRRHRSQKSLKNSMLRLPNRRLHSSEILERPTTDTVTTGRRTEETSATHETRGILEIGNLATHGIHESLANRESRGTLESHASLGNHAIRGSGMSEMGENLGMVATLIIGIKIVATATSGHTKGGSLRAGRATTASAISMTEAFPKEHPPNLLRQGADMILGGRRPLGPRPRRRLRPRLASSRKR